MRAILTLILALGCSASPLAADGKLTFLTFCARCHGEKGTGGVSSDGGPAPRNFHDHAFHAARTDAELQATITMGKGTAMPAFGTAFGPAQLEALVKHVRSFDPGRSR